MRTFTQMACRLVPPCCLRALAICLLLGEMSAPLFSQMASILVIDSIQVSGQKKTRVENILRELPFRRGDTVPQEGLTTLLADGERWLMQTGLFNSVQIAPQYPGDDGNRIQISILVSEAWYIFPVPIFELADRNFNVWWVDQRRSLDRINYGLDFRHRNLTGRRDRARINFKTGYTQLFQFQYVLPFFNRAKTWGFSAGAFSARNREVNYATIENRQAFFRMEDGYALRRFSTQIALLHRPGLNQYHRFQLGYVHNQVDEKVSRELNPGYFMDGRQSQRFFSLAYEYVFDDRDIRPYPLSGSFFSLELKKDGLGIFKDRNALTLFGDYRIYADIGDSPLNLAFIAKGKYSLIRRAQPYNDNRAIGFQERTLRGYEYYIIDGPDMILANASLRMKIWENQINFGKLSPVEQLRKMPIKVFTSLNSDWGYVNNPWDPFDNSFNNRLLWGGGLGLDLVFFFDFALRIEGSVNHLGQAGLYLNFKTGL